jgi:curli biogenesis system outer membrane secretion channel CsgG
MSLAVQRLLRRAPLLTPVAAVLLTGCLATTPQSGGQSATAATGAAAGASTEGASSSLETCTETLGTIRIDEQTNAGWYAAYVSQYRMGSTVPALKMLIQQSNCFMIVDRSRGLRAGEEERSLMRSDEGRAGSNYGKGQIAAADYTIIPEVLISDRGGTRGGAGLGGLVGGKVGALLGTFSTNEAGVMLTLIDNRSSIQLSAAEGYAKNIDFGAAGALFGGSAGGGAGAYTSTPQGKVILAAFMDGYNKMVKALRNYKAQTVKGGAGTGGTLGVQGGSTPASANVGKKKPQQ